MKILWHWYVDDDMMGIMIGWCWYDDDMTWWWYDDDDTMMMI